MCVVVVVCGGGRLTDGLVLASVHCAGDSDAAGAEGGDGHAGGDGAAVTRPVVTLVCVCQARKSCRPWLKDWVTL